MSDNRPARYIDGDTVVYRASSLGSCDRAIVATSQEYPVRPHPEWFQTVLDEGTSMEGEIQQRWDAATEIPTHSQQMPVELEIGEVNGKRVAVRGHIDGLAGTGGILREFKKVREASWDRFIKSGVEYLPTYPWQVSVYMLATGCELELVGGMFRVDEWGVGAIADHHVHRLEASPLPLKAIVKRVLALEGLIAKGFDAREVECDRSMYPCPYFGSVHPDAEEAYELPELGDAAGLARQYIAQLSQATHELGALKLAGERWEKQKKVAAEGLRACLGALGPEAEAAKKLQTDEWVVTRVRKTTPEHVRKEVTVDYFMVKPKEQNNG